ncbi:MAG: hypothetical protein ACI8XM_000929 [Haloarculaceae archaeon]|jgi:hypothetical protein
MASTGYHDTGEEFIQKTAFRQDLVTRPVGIDILLYQDSTDSLDDSDDVDAISTEPETGNYTRVTAALDSTDIDIRVQEGDIDARPTVTFDVTDTTESVDAYAAVIEFQSEIAGDDAASQHLLASAPLDEGTVDLGPKNDLQVTVDISLD